MKNLNYKWVLLIGAVLGLIVGTFNKDDWETIPMENNYVLSINHSTGEVWFLDPIDKDRWQKVGEPIHGFKVWFFGSD